ncbi:transposase [Streptomyces sp. NPDC002205]|uniref:transposase n=1 Tax=Streptomyces sp. NPDC002205 TaxID=3154411 RepID=UPI00332815B8
MPSRSSQLAIADTGYGDAAAFRLGLQTRGLNYVVGISTTLSAQPGEAVPVSEPYSGNGRPPERERSCRHLERPDASSVAVHYVVALNVQSMGSGG